MARVTIGRRVAIRDFQGSAKFDGSASVIKISNQPIYNLVNYSVSFWMNAVEQADDKYIITNGYSGINTPMWGLDYKKPAGTSYNLRVFIRDDSNNVLSGAGDITPKNLVHGRWYHVVFTDAGGSMKCYINGVYQGINPTYTRGTLTLNQTAFGALWRTGVGNQWSGRLANVKIFNQAFTDTQAADMYYNGYVSGISPVASYSLSDGPTTYVDSISANSGTGTSMETSTSVPMRLRTTASSRINISNQYIPNPYMDDDDGTGKPAGWTSYQAGDGDTVYTRSIDRTDFVTGTGSHKITIKAPSGTYRNHWTLISLPSIFPANFIRTGRTIRVFFRYKTSTGTYAYVGFSNASTARKIVESAPTVWTEATVDVTFAKPETALDLQIQCKNTNATDTATVWIDEIRISHIPRTTV